MPLKQESGQVPKERKKLKRQKTLRTPLPPFNQELPSIELKKRRESSSSFSKLTLRITTRWYRAPEVILL